MGLFSDETEVTQYTTQKTAVFADIPVSIQAPIGLNVPVSTSPVITTGEIGEALSGFSENFYKFAAMGILGLLAFFLFAR